MEIKLSVIILSITNNAEMFKMTSDCIDSLQRSEVKVNIEILIIESNKNYTNSNWQYPDFVKVIIPESNFNFHKFLNIGIRESTGDFIALCNNDLIFTQNWFTEILHVKNRNPKIKSFSPSETQYIGRSNDDFISGYKIRQHIKGWCIVVERDIFQKIGYLDESFDFYFADNDYAMTLRMNNLKHALVCRSFVKHLEKKSSGEILQKHDENNNFLSKYNVPKYLRTKNFAYILENEKNISGFLKFHFKWGTPKTIYRKNKIADFLFKYNLGYFVRFIIRPKKEINIFKKY